MSRSETDQLEALFDEVNSLAIHLRGGLGPVGGEEGFTGAVSGVLQALAAGGPHTVPEVARERRTSRQNIQVVVNRLKKAGLVEMESNPAHKRSSLVRLTGKGKAAFGLIQETESERLESLLAQIQEEDLACARRVLSQLCQSLGGRGVHEAGHGQANLQRSRSSAGAKAKVSRRRNARPPSAMEGTSDEEVFPLNLL